MYIVLALLFYILFGTIVNDSVVVSELYSVGGIIFVSIFVLFQIHLSAAKYKSLFILAYVLRLLILIIDYNQIFLLPNSGGDSERFYLVAYHNILSTAEDVYLTKYSVFLTFLFELIGPQRLFAQYLNVLFGMGTLFVSLQCLSLYKFSNKKTRMSLWVIAIFPQLLIFSGILLREALIIFLTIYSFYHFLRWYKWGKIINFVYSCFLLLLAAALHSGMVGMLIGYFYVYSFYDRNKNKFSYSVKSCCLVFALFLCVMPFIISSGFFTEYFGFLTGSSDAESEELMLQRINYKEDTAGSAYLTDLEIDSFSSLILYSPIKLLYFLFSPMPWNFRGGVDLFSFCLDSFFYLWLLYKMYKPMVDNKRNRLVFLLGFWISVIFYSWGTIAAGTAIRHRAKFFPVLVISYVCITENCYSIKRKSTSNYRRIHM